MFNSVKGLFTIILLAALATLGMANKVTNPKNALNRFFFIIV